ncbi:asparagine synthase [Nocardia nova SH22a]|uniref:asparagine synthase (glutamine-hydrolyzing) n=1 Tax=Nocardia nova SH22a TaxID=1415166 RepID=W5TG60_9NOCA|nr:asparagine synthase (glutamine-hydrolyzing) [Nocardia nova]AHH17963.1 asparagine synthase [Nocardia nova SH22a]
MCGIAGWVAFSEDLTRRQADIDAMTETMACRGPDGRGTFVREHAALGHRRLAIIDLPGGTQPMSVSTPAGDVGLIYSGETYNFGELREQLRGLGHRFETDSDTEVVLHGYLQWGESVVDHLNGMYAFAIWDDREQKLVMIRDRMGIKPFYYYPTPDGVLFGSEPKAILANPLAARAVDLDGVRELFAMTKAPGWSLWKGMHEVLPGTLVTVDRNGIRTRTYWRLNAVEHTDGRDETVSHVRDLLTDIVDRQLISDVPRCVLLSGGLDSSAITGLAAARLARNGEQLRTFSVDFADQEQNFVPDEMRDTPDSPFVREVAALVRSAHEDVVLNPADLSDPAVRRAVITARDIPAGLGDMDASLYLLFAAIRKQSTVALSGESADEVFGGYRWFHDEVALKADTFPWLAFNSAMTGESRWEILNPGLRERLALPEFVADQYATAVAEVEHLDGESEVEHRMRTVCHLHLTRFVRMLLDRKDRASMAVGLEVRVPFCDHRLVEYVYNTPWSLKTFDGREKSLLRHAAKHVLPDSVVQRVKSPYPSTQDPGYAAVLQQQAKEIAAAGDSPVFELIDRQWLERAVALDASQLDTHLRMGLDRIIDLHTWLELYSPELQLG